MIQVSFSVSCPLFILYAGIKLHHFITCSFALDFFGGLGIFVWVATVHMINVGPTQEVTPPCSPVQNPPTPTLLRSMGKRETELLASGFTLPEASPSAPSQKTPLFPGRERGRGALKRATKLARRGRGCRGGGHWERCLKPHGGEEARHRASLYAGSRSPSWSPASV